MAFFDIPKKGKYFWIKSHDTNGHLGIQSKFIFKKISRDAYDHLEV